MRVYISPCAHPEAFVYAHIGEVELILASDKVFHTHGVVDRKLWRIKVHRQTLLLCVDVCLARAKAQTHLKLGSAQAVHILGHSIACLINL